MRKSENQQWTVSEITLVKNDEWDGNVGNSDLVISTQNCSRDVGKIVNINKNNSEITAQVEGEHMTEELKFPVTMLDFQAVNGDLVILGNFICYQEMKNMFCLFWLEFELQKIFFSWENFKNLCENILL